MLGDGFVNFIIKCRMTIFGKSVRETSSSCTAIQLTTIIAHNAINNAGEYGRWTISDNIIRFKARNNCVGSEKSISRLQQPNCEQEIENYAEHFLLMTKFCQTSSYSSAENPSFFQRLQLTVAFVSPTMEDGYCKPRSRPLSNWLCISGRDISIKAQPSVWTLLYNKGHYRRFSRFTKEICRTNKVQEM